MRIELPSGRPLRRFGLALGLAFAACAAQAQTAPAAYGPSPDPVVQEQAPPTQARRQRARIRPYLEVAQVLSADLGGGDTLTYTSVAAGVDGRVQTRRITAQMSYRYERHIEWGGEVGDRDAHSGVAMVNAQIVPGLLQFDAGALATRTGGEGRALGVADRDAAVNVYGAYAGPTLSAHAGPVAINASYRLGYVAIDDDRIAGGLDGDFNDSVAHSATASVGMAPGRAPVGWTIGAGYARENSGGRFDNEFEGAYVRGDVVVPVGPTLALTAGIGYEDMESSQLDIARDSNNIPVIDASGRPIPDPARPRLLTYDLSGIMYDAGVIWRPSSRTELQARAGHRYGGTTVTASLRHRFNDNYGINAQVYDSVETFGHLLTTDISTLPADFDINRDPLTGGLGGCVFGSAPGSGTCLDRSLQSITSSTFRLRGGNFVFSGNRGLWSFGAGAGYAHRRYFRPVDGAFDALVAGSDESVSLYGSLGRRLSRNSQVNLNAFASWFGSDLPAVDGITTSGATLSYGRSFLLDRLSLMAAVGLYHSSSDSLDTTTGSASLGLRYTF